jgi:hypothetical protein
MSASLSSESLADTSAVKQTEVKTTRRDIDIRFIGFTTG